MTVRALALAGLAAAGLAFTPSEASTAEFTIKDGQVLGRTLGFVGDGMTGIAIVGVVFEPASATSIKEAELIQRVIGNGMPAGRINLQTRLVPVGEVSGITGISALYVTSGLAANIGPITDAAQRLHIPTVSANLTCVQTGPCVVGYASEPTIQIIIDHGAAERAGIRFLQAFRMLVREK